MNENLINNSASPSPVAKGLAGDALKVHWKLPLRYDGAFVLDANGAEVCSFWDSNFGNDADFNHAAAFVALANGGLLEKCFAMAMEIDRLKDALKPVEAEWPKWFCKPENDNAVIRFDSKIGFGLWHPGTKSQQRSKCFDFSCMTGSPTFIQITAAQAAEILKGGGR